MYASILAGGSGTRLWPLSTKATPKQFLRLTGDRTLLQATADRLGDLVAPDQLYVVTFAQYRETVAAQLPALPPDHNIAEPAGRGTAASVGLAATLIAARDPDAVIGNFPADHDIRDAERFRAALRLAERVAREGYLVTLGIHPTYPETGYGYIHYAEPFTEAGDLDAHHVARFVEKPPRDVAEEYVRSGDYAWNAGIFVWRADRILAEIRRQQPIIAGVLDEIGAAARGDQGRVTPAVGEVIARAWQRLTHNITVDYGVMEHAERIAVIPVDVGWNDVGSWAQVASLQPSDATGNSAVTIGGARVLSAATGDTLVYSTTGRTIATAGLSGLVIVDTADGLLICAKDAAQRVKDLAEQAGQLPAQLPAQSLEPFTREPDRTQG